LAPPTSVKGEHGRLRLHRRGRTAPASTSGSRSTRVTRPRRVTTSPALLSSLTSLEHERWKRAHPSSAANGHQVGDAQVSSGRGR